MSWYILSDISTIIMSNQFFLPKKNPQSRKVQNLKSLANHIGMNSCIQLYKCSVCLA